MAVIGRMVFYGPDGLPNSIVNIVKASATRWYAAHGEQFPRDKYPELATDEEVDLAKASFRERIGEQFPRAKYQLATDDEVARAKDSFRDRIKRKQNPLWKQECPHDQMTVILMALEGHLDIYEDDIIDKEIIDKETFCHHVRDFHDQLKDLLAFFGRGCWPVACEICKKEILPGHAYLSVDGGKVHVRCAESSGD